MSVTFEDIELGQRYSRPQLVRLWGYKGFQAIGRGVFTPAKSNKIVLFITGEKQSHLTQYKDVLDGDTLKIEGEKNHIADKRLINASAASDEIHLFYRERHHQNFIYYGEISLVAHQEYTEKPSTFSFSLNPLNAVAQNSLATDEEAFGTFSPDEEGKKRTIYSTRYERSPKNRAAALMYHGTKCKACGFDFDKQYGERHARHYIQIHHVHSVTSGLRRPNFKTDLVPLCANCHAMAHRTHGKILSLQELKSLLRNRATT
jgi:hypothetical protein